jgi:signal peptidase I
MASAGGELTAVGQPAAVPAARSVGRRAGRTVFWVLFVLAVISLCAGVAATVARVEVFTDSSTAMQHALPAGSKLTVLFGADVRRGDVVVFRRPGNASSFVKRLIGLPGDHVACCTAGGRVSVNGRPLDETYVYPGNAPSTVRFSVTLRQGQMWVLGDHRNISLDSREWGPVPLSGVVGRVVLVDTRGSYIRLRTPQTFVAQGLAARDTRWILPAAAVLPALAGAVALVVLTVFGIIRFVIRRLAARSAMRGVD